MRCLRRLLIGGVLLIFASAPAPALAVDATLTGTFRMNFVSGNPGKDMLETLGHDNGFELVLHDVTFACENVGFCNPVPWDPCKTVLVHATSFGFRFTGMDSTVLNREVGSQLKLGGIAPDVFIAVVYQEGRDRFFFSIWPPDPSEGIVLEVGADPELIHDGDDCPTLRPLRAPVVQTVLFDRRDDIGGNIAAINSGEFSFDFFQTPTGVPPLEGTTRETASWGQVKGLFR